MIEYEWTTDHRILHIISFSQSISISLSISLSLSISSLRSPFFFDKSFLDNYRRLLGNTTDSSIQLILSRSMSNAIRILAFRSYSFSLGQMRFSRLQVLSTLYEQIYADYPSSVHNAYAILQLAALLLPANEVVWTMTRVFLHSLCQTGEDDEGLSAVGRRTMHSYLLLDLLAICYQRHYFTRDNKVGMRRWECLGVMLRNTNP